MKDLIKLSGAVVSLVLFGALIGGSLVWNHVRANGIEANLNMTAQDLNQRVFPGIQDRIEKLEDKVGIIRKGGAPAPEAPKK